MAQKPHKDAVLFLAEERGMSLAKLAEKCGISAPYLSQILNGSRNGKGVVFNKMAAELRCPLAVITLPGFVPDEAAA